MNEFKLETLLASLLIQLNVSESPDRFLGLINKQAGGTVLPQIMPKNTLSTKKRLSEKAKDPQAFLTKCDQLKVQVRELDHFLLLLDRLADDLEVCAGLSENSLDERLKTMEPDDALKNAPEFNEINLLDIQSRLQKANALVSTMPSTVPLRATPLPPQKLKIETATPSLQGPKMPAWIKSGEHVGILNLSKSSEPSSAPILAPKPPVLGQMSLAVQEQALIEDLLFLMVGFDGRYIRIEGLSPVQSVPPTFKTDPSVDKALGHLVGRIVPICAAYIVVVGFIEERMRFEYGLVCHATCAAMRTLIKEYLVLVSQLENDFLQGNLTLQRLWFYIQPSLSSMKSMETLVYTIVTGRVRGGALLDLLHNNMISLSGDVTTHDLYGFLLEEAARPYFIMLDDWIYRGTIEDPYKEFLIIQDSKAKERQREEDSDKYWKTSYIIASPPEFLRPVANTILVTGKYLNVIRECGILIQSPFKDKVKFSLNERMYMEAIHLANEFASKELLNLLMKDRALLQRLKSVKQYFFLESGDFLVHFMDIAGEELQKHVENISLTKVQSLLELALRTSISVGDPYHDDLKVTFSDTSLLDQLMRILSVNTESDLRSHNLPGIVSSPMHVQRAPTNVLTGIEALTLDYTVHWPLSLVLSRKELTKYQLIFRHVFFCQHVEKQLCRSWVSHQRSKRAASAALVRAFSLRHRMLAFVQNFEYYVMIEVLEPNWRRLEQQLDQVHTVDEVMRHHMDFLDTCLKECMLTDEQLLKKFNRLLSVCLVFCNISTRMQSASALAALANSNTQTEKRASVEESWEKDVRKYDEAFSHNLRDLFNSLHYTADGEQHMVNLASRLDYNGYYSLHLPRFSSQSSSNF